MSEKEKISVKDKKYDLVPPDGGWGYMICIAAIINYSATMMFFGCFGMIFNDFMIEIEMGSTSLTVMGGINAMCVAFSGFFTNLLLKLMSMRKLAFLASVFFNAGVFCTIFVKTKPLFFICQGLLQSTGVGLIFNLSCTLLNEYFLKKRLMVVSLTQTVTAFATMVAPQLVRWSLEELGFRGTLIVISAISMQTFIAVALMQPASWHMKKVELPDTSTEEIRILLDEKSALETSPNTRTITLTDAESSLEQKIGVQLQNGTKSHEEKTCNNIFRVIVEFLDIPLLKKFMLSISSLGPTFALFIDTMYMIMCPQALYAMGWNKSQVAHSITLVSLGDLATRASFTFFSNWLVKFGNHEIYIVGLIIAVISRLGMLWTENVTVMLIFITIMGVARCALGVLPPLIFADSYEPEKFTSVMGIFMMVFGLMHLVLGPAFGAVRDMTDSYPTVFYMATSCLAAVTLLWCIELCYKRNKQKRQLQREAAEKSRRNKTRI